MATAIITTGRMIMTVRSFALLTILVTGYTLAVEQLLVRKRINALEVDAKKTRKLGSVGSDEQTASKGFGSILKSTKEYKGDKAWEDVSYSFKGDNKAILSRQSWGLAELGNVECCFQSQNHEL